MSRNQPTISKGIDWSLVWIYFILSAIGITAIFAVTYKDGDPIIQTFLGFKTDYSKQLYFFFISMLLGIFILLTDSKFFAATSNLLYAFGIFTLLLVFPFHSNIKGTESIIKLGNFNFQPAEFCKVFVCLALAKYLSRPETDFSKTRSQLIAAAIALLPAMMAVAQSETGLALILIIGFIIGVLVVSTLLVEKFLLAGILTGIAILTVYFLWRQIKRRREYLLYILIVWGICVSIQLLAVPFVFKNVLKLYQVERIYSTVGMEVPKEYLDAHKTETNTSGKKKDTDYNVRQSKIAIGSGQLTGKGLLKGTQTRYGFVPEQRTDFIFDTIGEGFGFIGTSVVLSLFLVLLFRIITIAERQRSTFSRCYAYGVAAVFFFHIVINVCMTIGLAPVIGIPLPFISYGGTSLLTNSMLLAILIRLDADRQMVLR
jgi:rod shape determining protein RodA